MKACLRVVALDTEPKMAEAPVEASLNEGALKRFDPYIKEIIDTAKYVALYSFVDSVWTKTKVEGSLFVYARTGEPLYNILVLNRLDSKNLVEPITPQLDIQRSEPYLLYKNSEGNIFGIWFFDVADCIRLTDLIQTLMERSVGGPRHPPPLQPNNEQGVDIFKMLTKAQEAYSANEGRPIPQRKQSPREIDGTPRSVAEFFAKAGSAPTETLVLKRTQSISENEPVTGLLQQLMANPVHSVEHIEKQQRVVTPHSADPVSDQLKQLLGPHSIPMVLPNVVGETSRQIHQLGANGFSITQFEQSLTLHHEKPGPGANGHRHGPVLASPPGFPVVAEDKKPDLMPPAMFTPREKSAATSREVRPLPPEPLTKNQLLQAFDYLLRNDPQFMTKLHEAYVKSLTDKIF